MVDVCGVWRRRIARWTLTWKLQSACVVQLATMNTPYSSPTSTTNMTLILRRSLKTCTTTRRRWSTSADSSLKRFVVLRVQCLCASDECFGTNIKTLNAEWLLWLLMLVTCVLLALLRCCNSQWQSALIVVKASVVRDVKAVALGACCETRHTLTAYRRRSTISNCRICKWHYRHTSLDLFTALFATVTKGHVRLT